VNGAAVVAIATKEMRDARHNRWFVLDAAAFLVLALGLSYLGLTGDSLQGMAGFGRTSAALVNLVLLIVPLMGLSVGAMSMAGEREHGTLATLLTQPLTRLDLLTGKWLGLAAALVAAILVGFGIPGLIMAIAGSREDVASYLGLTGLSLLVGLTGLGLGMLISCAVRTTSIAIGLAIGVWLLLVFFGDLGLLGIGMGMRLDSFELLLVALLNPLTDFRIAAITTAGASPETLGPAGLLLFDSLGFWTPLALAALLVVWAGGPLLWAYRLLRKADLT
jgi:Cu-processing system permease protein